MILNKFKQIGIGYAMNPANFDVAKIYVDYYWVMYDNSILVHKKNGGCLCNSNKEIAESFSEKIPNSYVLRIPLIFVEWKE